MPCVRGIWRKARVYSLLFAFDVVAALAIFGGAPKVPSIKVHLFQSISLPILPRKALEQAAGKAMHLSYNLCHDDNQDNNQADNGSVSPSVDQDADAAGLGGFREIVDDFGLIALEKQSEGEDEGEYQWIRLEKDPDASFLENILTRSDVVGKIREVRLDQSRYGCSDLYPREWEGKEQLVCKTGICTNPVTSFSVMQFNALAEGLSSGPNSKPFNLDPDGKRFQNDTKGYGGFTSIPHPTVTLDFGRRKWRLLEVLLGSDGVAPFDVVAIEEIDRYRGFFAPVLSMFGYVGLFVPKKKSPGVRMGWYSDGCALVWKSETFDLIFERSGDYKVGNQVFIIAALRHRASGIAIVVAVTHLKAQRNEANEWTRSRQVEELLVAVDDVAMRAAANDGVREVPILILGDFNADPPSKVGFKESAIERLLTHPLGSASSPDPPRYRSAYDIDDPTDNLFTSWKIRGSTASKRIIDYIFYTGDAMQCIATLRVPPVEELELTKLPGLRYPSDHLHIAAQFEIR